MSASVEIIPFLKSVKLFDDFPESELILLLPFIEPHKVAKGSFIMKEGEQGDTLCIIRKGQVEVVKEDGKQQHRLAVFGPGECVGEMALFDRSRRSASVIAIEDVEVVLLALGESKRLPDQLVLHLARKISGRLRTTNEIVVKSLQERLEVTQIHSQMGDLIIQLLIMITAYFFIFKLFHQHASESVFVRSVSAILILGIALWGIVTIMRTGYPLKFYGLTLNNAWKYALESISFTLPIMGVLVILKWFTINFIPMFKNLPLFQFGHEKQPFWSIFTKENQNTETFFLLSALYILLVPVQEFIVRGCLQSSFEKFFRGANKTFMAIFASNLLFMLFHGMKTFSFIFAAFLFGLFWGWLYARQKSLVGVSISHVLIGIWAFGVLGLESILIY